MEEKKFKRTLVTTALPYANGPVHIGHLAGDERARSAGVSERPAEACAAENG